MKTEKNKGGRPRTDATPITVRVYPDMLAWLDEQRDQQDDQPSRPEMIRRLLEERKA